MPITAPSANADTYLDEDNEDVAPKVGTTVQEGWDAANESMTKKQGDYPVDMKFSSEATLVKFLDVPPLSYQQHWIDRPKGRKSFTCIGEDCPLCDVLGDEPRNKTAFQVYVLSGDTQGLQILTAVPTLFRLIKKANEDDRKGPIGREFWAVSRTGTGKETLYSLDYVRARDLEEEWGLNPEKVTELVASATPWSKEQVVRNESRSDLLEVARSLID